MRWMRILRQRARSLFRGARADAELDKELAFHLEELARENMAAGMDAAEARMAARRTLGGVAQISEQCRDQRRVGWLTDLRKDVSYAWRMLMKSPGFTALAVLTLALGAGASIAVYTLAEAVLLRSLPYPSPERLAAISSWHVRHGESGVGQEDFREWKATNTVFEGMAFTEFSQMTLTGMGDAERVTGRAVSEGFFELFGVAPRLGRCFTPEEETPGGGRVVLLSHGFWVRKFGGRPAAVGATLFLNDRAYRVTGVMPESFRFNEGRISEYWTPIAYRNFGHQNHQYAAYGRLKTGVTVKAAQKQMSEIARRMEAAYPDNAGWGVRVVSLRSELLGETGPALLLFAAAALIVLLVACANVASLLLARGIGRSREIAVRMALGAGGGRVVRLLLTESLLLSSLGAGGGIVLAFWLLRLAVAAAPPWFRLGDMIAVSPGLAAFAIALTLATGVLTGLWPAVRGTRTDVHSDLKEGGSSLAGGRRQARSLSTLVVAEIAMAVVLLTSAGLLARSFSHLLHTQLGYRADHLITFRMPLPSRYRTDQARLQFWNTLLPRLAAVPGVVSAAAADSVPLGGTYSGTPAALEGQTVQKDWADVMTRAASVSPDYFRTMGIAVRAGRGFDTTDVPEGEPVVIVNESFVRKLMPEGSPIGRHVRLGGEDKWRRIVGVIADTRYGGPARPPGPEAYLPFTQGTFLQFVALRTAVPEAHMMGAVRKAIRELDPALPVTQVQTMRESLDAATALPRQMMAAVAGFAGVALGMATLGLAGVVAYTVSRRRREIGLRLALGARRADISRGVVLGAARLVLAGTAIGMAGALAAARVLESLLYGVRGHDPATLVAAPAVLAAIALAACLAPAHRASRIEPMSALREE
jgi:predicted permease